MQIELDSVAIGHGLGASVPELTVAATDGAPTVIAVETAERPMLVSLLLGGRIRPDSGSVTVDGRDDLDELRKRTALVDTPVVAEPTPGLSLASIVAEEFSFAGLSPSRREVRSFLDAHGLLDYGTVPVRSLPPAKRTRLFSELALLRPGVSALVVTSPERHGGDPAEWYETLAAIAQRGITIVVVTDAATRGILLSYGARDALDPLPVDEPLDDPTPEPLELESETQS
jgi:ABC-2 type transport system ATP-binding protein